MEHFLWIPGQGHDVAALKRLQLHFVCPPEPMGEAWFMGKREMFQILYDDLDTVELHALVSALETIASGTGSFGYLEEWHTWHHFLMAQLIPRSHDHCLKSLLEYLVTAFITQYPEGIINEPYEGFKKDVLNTLGKSIMDNQLWSGNEIIIGKILHRSNNNPAHLWGWYNTSGDLSASLFFCLKYLPSEKISEWFVSVLEISSPHWRAQMIVWMAGAYKILHGEIKQASEFNEHPSVEWAWSFCLNGNYTGDHSDEKPVCSEFIPYLNRVAILETIENYFSEKLYLEWLVSISSYDYLETEIGDIPDQFLSLYRLKK